MSARSRDPADIARQTSIVAFFRGDPWPRMRRILWTGPPAVTLGTLVGGASFLPSLPRDIRVDAAAVSFVLIAGAVIFTVVAMHAILRDEVFLAIRTDGVCVRAEAGEACVEWGALRHARWDPEQRAVILESTSGETLVLKQPLAGIEGPDVVARIERSRKRVALGIPL